MIKASTESATTATTLMTRDSLHALLKKEDLYMQRLTQHLPASSTLCATSSASTSTDASLYDSITGNRTGYHNHNPKKQYTYLQLEHIYDLSLSNQPKSNTRSKHFHQRVDIVDFLYKVVDYYEESRDIVQIVMNYLDRYFARSVKMLLSQTNHRSDSDTDTAAAAATADTAAATDATAATNPAIDNATCTPDATGTPYGKAATQSCGISNTTKFRMQERNEETATISDFSSNADSGTTSPSTVMEELNENTNRNMKSRDDVALAVLSCLDLAIKVISPFSGNMRRATYVEIVDEVLQRHDTCNHTDKEEEGGHTTRSWNKNDPSSSSSSSTVQDIITKVLKTTTQKEIASRLSTKYNAEQFESARQLSRKVYSKLDHAIVQNWVMDNLEYYLYPTTSSEFLGYFLDLLNHQNSDDKGCECKLHATATTTTFDSDAIMHIMNSATMQIEIAMFDIKLAMTKPSILAFCALQNAIIQHFYTQYTNAPIHPPPHESYYFATFIREKLCYSNIVIGKHILNLDAMDLFHSNETSEIRNVMDCLFHHWKNNTPNDTTHEDDIMSTDTYFTLFPSNSVNTNLNITSASHTETTISTKNCLDEMVYSHHNHFIPIDPEHDNNDSIIFATTNTTAPIFSNSKKRVVSCDDTADAGANVSSSTTRIENNHSQKKRKLSVLETELVKNGAIFVPARKMKCVMTSQGLKYI